MSTVEPDLAAARDAARRHDWREAFELLLSADRAGRLEPDDLDLLAEVAWWLYRLDVSIAARERAYQGFLRLGDRRRAGMVAIDLAKHHYAKGQSAIGSGHLANADRLLSAESECVERGYLARIQSVLAFEGKGDFDTALKHADVALEIASRFQDRDLLALAVHDRGRVLVAKGLVAEGNALLDEATVAAVAGELKPMSTGIIYCNVISSCEELADYRRAGEWTEAASRWCERQSIGGFPGICRVHRSAIMRLRGEWSQAEREARRACTELREFNVGYAAAALYEIGEGRLAVGDLPGAEEAFREAHELGRNPEPGLSVLRLAEGDVAGATAGISRALSDEELTPLRRARLLPARVEIGLAAGDRTTARAAADELATLATTYRTPAIRAAAATAMGSVLHAEGDCVGAIQEFKRAWRSWNEVDAPYEAAKARAALGRAYLSAGDSDAARLELEAAKSAFDRLGAIPDSSAIAQTLGPEREAGIASRAQPATKTFLFTDIVRSTALVEAIGDAAWNDVVRWHDATLRALFAEHNGEEVDHAGDGFFVAFNGTTDALDCAVAIQRKLARHRRAHGFAPEIRIGIHGAEVNRRGTGYKGKGVHAASRIASLAGGSEIVVSTQTLGGASRYPTSQPRNVTLRGMAAPVEVVTIEWGSAASGASGT
jgi:class 3 adenylate cyclase